MIELALDEDEYYPFRTVSLVKERSHFCKKVKLSEEEYLDYKITMMKFDYWQDKLREMSNTEDKK